MGFFDKLFGNPEMKKPGQPDLQGMPKEAQEEFKRMMSQMSGTSHTPEQFKIELYDALKRYYATPELEVELNLTGRDGKVYQEHEAFGGTFAQWQQVQTVWDRRSILFEHLDASEFKKLEKWQVVERFVKDRHGLKAIEYHKANITNDDFQDIRLIVALSKLFRAMDAQDNAMHFAKGAYELRPELDIVKVEYANVLHLSGSEEERTLGHTLMDEVLKAKIDQADEQKIALLNYFVFSPGYIDSSVFALSFLHHGNCTIETWEKLAEEYYWCPVFRYEHSVFLSTKGESIRAFAKIQSLANEFPWYRTGVLACMDAINQLRQQKNDPHLMRDEMAQMERYKKMWND